MSVDPARYGLITNEFRFGEVFDQNLSTTYTKAREMVIESNLQKAKITALLTDMFAVIGSVRRRFSVDLSGTDHFTVDSFAFGPPMRYFTCPEFGVTNLPVVIVACTINEDENLTSVELWG